MRTSHSGTGEVPHVPALGRPNLCSTVTAVALLLLNLPGDAVAQTLTAIGHRLERIDDGREFDGATEMAVGPEGSLHVAYPRRRILRMWDGEASGWRTVPLAGVEGTSVPRWLGWQRDTLWVADQSSSMVAFLDSTGGVVRTVPVYLPDPSSGAKSRRILAVRPNDRLIVETSASLLSMALADPRFEDVLEEVPPSLSLPYPIEELPVWVVQADGVVLDTIANLSTRNRWTLVHRVSTDPSGRISGRWYQRPQPYTDHPLVGMDPEGERLLVVDRSVPTSADRPTFTLHRIAMSGDTTSSRAFDYDPVPVVDAWVEDALRLLQEDIDGDPAAARQDAEGALYRPRWLPPVSGLHVDSSGWVWLRRESVPDAERITWELVDPNNRRVGTIEVDASLRMEAVSGRTAWATLPADGGSPRKEIWFIDAR